MRHLVLMTIGLLFSIYTYAAPVDRELSNPKATTEAKALYKNLGDLQGKAFLFGHQDSLAYGFDWEKLPDMSDVKVSSGSYPALYGWDLGRIELGEPANVDGVSFDLIRDSIKSGFSRGGVITISWHITNPVTGGSHSDNKTQAVHEIISGGKLHQQFIASLDKLIAFNEQLKIKNVDGKEIWIPIIFRPWHEHNGEWFWWGKGNTTEENYIKLYRFTVNYLRKKGQHNLIFAYSPDRSRIDMENFTRDYMWGYPGDKYVDVIGLDDYWDLGHEANKTPIAEQLSILTKSLEQLVTIADAKNKLAALTEGGNEAFLIKNFYTQHLLKGILANDKTRRIAYAMVWRNATNGGYNKKHFYVPYKNHPEIADFTLFKQNKSVLFEDELPKLYE
jgi:mannan endo-1,4-beta-mannosidase